ncbi:MAG: D-alanine--D-alanine ligase family protein [bacterium]
MKGKLTIGVVFGGVSTEHEISLISARSIIEAIDKKKYDIIPIWITKQGKWLIYEGDFKDGLKEESGIGVCLSLDPTQKGLFKLGEKGCCNSHVGIDVFFPVLHGLNGEDGTVQGLFEVVDTPFVGCGILASGLGIDKYYMKVVFEHDNLPVVDYLLVKGHERKDNRDQKKIYKKVEETIGYPCFIKPACFGSSIGISKVYSDEQLMGGIKDALVYDNKVLIEKYIDGREMECSVLGNEEPMASLPGEIVPCNDFYDYKAKYVDNSSKLIIPADLEKEDVNVIQELAIKAFRAIDGKGMARVDFFLSKNDKKIYINEINTIPGFTNISMYPKLWEASGIGYSELIDRLITLAIEK